MKGMRKMCRTLTIYFTLGKCTVVSKPVQGFMNSNAAGISSKELWVRLGESIWVWFLRGLIK